MPLLCSSFPSHCSGPFSPFNSVSFQNAPTGLAPIEKADVIPTNITAESPTIKVVWSQRTKQRSADYYIGKYTNTTKAGCSGRIFIKKDMLRSFNELVKDGKIVVDSKFQFGQKDKNGACRWIVFHNKDNEVFQQRFVTALAMTLGDGEKAAEAIGQMGYTLGDNPKKFLDQMGMTAGSLLRNF